MSNIHEIARRCDVSIATVSRVLNNKGPVKEDTRQKVLSVINEMNYKPNIIGRNLSRRKTDTIGVILPELADEFFMGVVHGMDEVANENGRYILISSSHSKRNDVETILDFMVSGRVDGVILMAPELNDKIYEALKNPRRPVIMLNCGSRQKNMLRFGIDNYAGARSVVSHLISHGYRRIATVRGPIDNVDAEERYRGYFDEMKAHNLRIDSSLIVVGKFSMRSGYHAFIQLMNLSERPEAIFFANDMMALGAYHAAHYLKIGIPDDVAMAGFDDIFTSSVVQPRLTTVHIPIEELGRRSMQYMIHLVESGEIPESYEEILPTRLVLGQSCGCNNTTFATE